MILVLPVPRLAVPFHIFVILCLVPFDGLDDLVAPRDFLDVDESAGRQMHRIVPVSLLLSGSVDVREFLDTLVNKLKSIYLFRLAPQMGQRRLRLRHRGNRVRDLARVSARLEADVGRPHIGLDGTFSVRHKVADAHHRVAEILF